LDSSPGRNPVALVCRNCSGDDISHRTPFRLSPQRIWDQSEDRSHLACGLGPGRRPRTTGATAPECTTVGVGRKNLLQPLLVAATFLRATQRRLEPCLSGEYPRVCRSSSSQLLLDRKAGVALAR